MKKFVYFIIFLILISFSIFKIKARFDNEPVAIQPLTQSSGATTSTSVKPDIATSTEPTVAKKEIIEYIVLPGDTISTIAQKFGVKSLTIMLANKLTASSLLKPGNKLIILPVDGILYRVKSGDTLSSISQLTTISNEEISKANDITSSDELKIGQTLLIPGATKTVSTKDTDSSTSVKSSANKVVAGKKITKKSTATKTKITKKPVVSSSSQGGVTWTAGALRELNRAPSFVRPSVRAKIVSYAKSHGIKVITKELYLGLQI